jgi:hypothetical protein
MSNTKYQLLPSNDGTPALEVNLTAVPTSTATVATVSALRPLNEQANDSASETINVNLTPVIEIEQQPLPPTSELPSYTDAVRAKKLEAASASDLPPSYFPHGTDIRIPVDPAACHGVVDLSDIQNYDQEICSECMFLSAFMIAFFFNWVGFFCLHLSATKCGW